MNAPPDRAAGPAVPRLRPRLHFTAGSGWTNDPHGIVHLDGRYHLFFQHNPTGTSWSPACHWGHATSDDLIVWHEEGTALTPADGEVGCWSGSLVVDDGTPTILYTRVVGDEWGRGQVAVARGARSMQGWRWDPREAVIDGPPDGLSTVAFRDPFVWRDAAGWTMVVGVGITGGTAAAVQYRSPDLLTWRYDGIVAQRPTTRTDGVWTGTLWECPQLFRLDGTWVLLVSVWDDHVLHHVAYALGDYDGRRFEPRTWGRFSHGDQLYATSAFLDADGRRCVMSWLRERDNAAPAGSAYAGGLSLPYTLALDGDTLVAQPHPNLARLWTAHRELRSDHLADDPIRVTPVGGCAELVLDVTAEPAATVTLTRSADTAAVLWQVTVDPARGRLEVHGDRRDLLLDAPLDPAATRRTVRLVADADILELTVSGVGGIAATRVAAGDGGAVTVHSTGKAAGVLRVAEHEGAR
jgi:beta-fructofuranosidase